MKILEENLSNQEVILKVESLNDLWTLYNLIAPEDHIRARTTRRVVFKEGTKGERKPMNLQLEVEDVAFHEFSNRLRVKGIILEGPDDYVSHGSYHTFNVEPGNTLVIQKKEWLKSELKRLREKSKFQDNFVMLVVVMESGTSNIALVTNYSSSRIASIKQNIPGKRYEQKHRNKALKDFFASNQKVIEENLKKGEVNLIIVSGPGNTRDLFINYLKEKSKEIDPSLLRSIHASSGTESAILETLKSNELSKIKKNVKVLQESERIERIFELLGTDADLVAIGFDEIEPAAAQGAIEELFIADLLIRGSSWDYKLKIEQIIINVENTGGEIHIMSTEHPTGQQIMDLGSLVGILRYKM